VTPAADFAQEHQDVRGESLAVCRWCAGGESRTPQRLLATADAERWQALRTESRDADDGT
jgi:hypothetical protein